MLNWIYFMQTPEPKKAGTQSGLLWDFFLSSQEFTTNTQWSELQQACWLMKQIHLWRAPPALSAVIPCWLWMPIGSFSSLPSWAYHTKPTCLPPPLTWHKASMDTHKWSFYSQTPLQLYINASIYIKTSMCGVLVFVLVVNLQWQFCSGGPDHPLHLILIQA